MGVTNHFLTGMILQVGAIAVILCTIIKGNSSTNTIHCSIKFDPNFVTWCYVGLMLGTSQIFCCLHNSTESIRMEGSCGPERLNKNRGISIDANSRESDRW